MIPSARVRFEPEVAVGRRESEDAASEDRASFERALVATSYLLGRRGAELEAGLGLVSAEARRVVTGLAHQERRVRAQVLAAELAVVASALASRSFR